jgi:predicted transcriptional regulator
MKKFKVQTLASLRTEMKSVARGERKAPKDAARMSFNSVGAMARLLTTDNRRLLAIIRDEKPASVAALAELSGRSQPNVTRTLNKFEAIGLVAMRTVGRRKAPTAVIRSVTVEIDPYSDSDLLTVHQS